MQFMIEKWREKMKKRLLALVLGMSMVLLLAGCSNEGKEEEKEAEAAIQTDNLQIAKYIGLEVEMEKKLEVTDEDVKASIQSTLSMYASENTEDVAEEGDLVIIDYEGKIDGVAFERGTATDQSITIGAGGYIPGFEDGIIGHKVGEEFDVPVTFPENYNADLAGKDAVFTMKLKGITPELTEDLLKKISVTCDTIEEYEAEQRAALEVSNQESYEYELEGRIWEALVSEVTVEEYPQDMLDEQYDTLENMFSEFLEEYDLDTLLKATYGIDAETYATNIVKQILAAEAIAEHEGIEVTEDEYKAYLEEYAETYGYEDAAEFESMVSEEALMRNFLHKEVMQFLKENCIVNE